MKMVVSSAWSTSSNSCSIWGVNSIFPHDFKAVSFGLYPIYGQVGAAYWF